MRLQWAGAEQCLLMLMVALPAIDSSSECPEDVQYTTNRCFEQYNNHAAPNQKYYSGMDVEVMRAICNALSRSVQCVIALKKVCPDEHADIMTVIEGPVINVADLCNVDNLIEKYARHQFCYTRLEPLTEECHADFSSETSSLEGPVAHSNPRAVTQFCNHFTTLVSCVRVHVEKACGSEAASLAEPLVRSSIVGSEHCRNDSGETTTDKTTTASRGWRTTAGGGLSHNQGSGAPPSTVSAFTTMLLLVSPFIANSMTDH